MTLSHKEDGLQTSSQVVCENTTHFTSSASSPTKMLKWANPCRRESFITSINLATSVKTKFWGSQRCCRNLFLHWPLGCRRHIALRLFGRGCTLLCASV